jgi:hypothetical protein
MKTLLIAFGIAILSISMRAAIPGLPIANFCQALESGRVVLGTSIYDAPVGMTESDVVKVEVDGSHFMVFSYLEGGVGVGVLYVENDKIIAAQSVDLKTARTRWYFCDGPTLQKLVTATRDPNRTTTPSEK